MTIASIRSPAVGGVGLERTRPSRHPRFEQATYALDEPLQCELVRVRRIP